ncbi:MAG: zinc carboxypeptidase, partial [Cyclobacteriaceae bacterium]|nr:zinc carboxypeptidase [Cyclobacteriaceae bacterium]
VVLYHLAAATGPEFEAFLERTIIVLDPCLNPDGHDRFAQWANSHRGRQLVSDPAHREHQETWPGGRTNHYWFDLNRDWLLLVHPESRGRVAAFQRWMPCVLTDHHEMGTDSTFFFQPGIPSRVNPLTPSRNIELTRALAEHHADALDGLGSLYFSEENFDDFYYGKGSTYPDIQGCI